MALLDTTPPKTTGLLCPSCKVSLVMSERQGVEIDYCPECRGVWLDRGELDKIIERSGPSADPREARGHTEPDRYDERYRDGRGEHGQGHGHGGGHSRRRKSWLSEIFD